jgi:hemerythrin-like domain-containing protein
MPHAAAAQPRPARANRPQRPLRAADAFEALDEAHRAAHEVLGVFGQLVAHLDDHGLDITAEALAGKVLAFFDGPGHAHHGDEERLVYPEIEALGDAELDAHLRRLRQDHDWIEQDWRELSPHVRAVAQGYNAYQLALLQAALPVFEALVLDHMALEETVVYPAARRLRAARAARSAAAA